MSLLIGAHGKNVNVYENDQHLYRASQKMILRENGFTDFSGHKY